MPLLSKAAGANVPHVFRQVFADAPDRTSDPTDYDDDDVNKIAFQIDTKEQYFLESIGPTVWTLITGTGAVAAGLVPLWRNDNPGDPFVDGDTVAAPGPLTSATTLYGRRIMFECPSGDTLITTLPLIGSTSAKRIGWHERTKAKKSIGTIRLDPAGTDNVEGFGDGTNVTLVSGKGVPWFEMEPDADGRWSIVVGLHVNAPADFLV